MFSNKQALLFDLDGTLVDSVGDLHTAINTMLDAFNAPSVGEDQVREWVGNGSLRLVERALSYTKNVDASFKTVNLTTAHDHFLTAYSDTHHANTRLCKGVKETLTYFAECRLLMAVITNKPLQFVPELLEAQGIDQFFDMVLGGDSLAEKKPSPIPLLFASEELGIPIENCLMIGDSESDILAAKAAGMQSVILSDGYHQGMDVTSMGADAVIDSVDALIGLVNDSSN
ncbi:MAG: phosphoglycolate phosphatase [Cellvibrionales bacterium]|nr:phosphoglycolate phosphatase [Cellvibrionales bacterium]